MNPGFEKAGWPPASWSQWDGSAGSGGVYGYISTSVSRSGAQSAVRGLWGRGSRWGGYTQDVMVKPGDLVRAGAWLMSKPDNNPLAGGAEACIELKFFDSARTELAAYRSAPLTCSSAWVRHTIEKAAPAGAVKAKFSFILSTDDERASGIVYFDDAHVRAGTVEGLAYEHIYYEMDKYYKESLDFTVRAADTVNHTADLNISSYVTISDSWQEVNIPLSALSSRGVDLKRMGAFFFIFNKDSAKEGAIYIDDIKLKKTSPQAELVIDDFQDKEPHKNSMGYWTSDGESCVFTGDENTTHKLIWNGNTDYWYTCAYNGVTANDISSYDMLSFKIRKPAHDTPRLIESYVPTSGYNANYDAKVYDNALAVCALIARGTKEDLTRAEILANGLKFCQDNDPAFSDGRLRDAYWSTTIEDQSTGHAAVKAAGSGCGNMAWAVIALTRFYETDPDNQGAILSAAQSLASFIKNNYYDKTHPGYYTGFDGWEPNQVLHTYKSAEINATVYAAFMALYDATSVSAYRDDALWAKKFLDEIAWNKADKFFWAGTLDDGVTLSTPGLYLDANTIPVMALGRLYPFSRSLDYAEANYALTKDGFTGYDCNKDLDGIWLKGTAQMGIAYSAIGNTDKAESIKNELRAIQIEGQNANGKGIIVASHDGVTSGWGYPYYASLHIGATAFFAMLEQGINPLWGTSLTADVPHALGRIRGTITLEGRTDYSGAYTFILSAPNETTPITGYNPINDEGAVKDGIQITLDETGSYSLFDIPAGTYDLSVKRGGHLRRTIEDIVIPEGGDVNSANFSALPAGDCNNDNVVNEKDSAVVNAAMGTSSGGPAWNEKADLIPREFPTCKGGGESRVSRPAALKESRTRVKRSLNCKK